MHINVPIHVITSLPSDKLGALVATLAAERPAVFGEWLTEAGLVGDVFAALAKPVDEPKPPRAPRARKPAAEGGSAPEGKRTKAAKVDDQRAAEILIALASKGPPGMSAKEIAEKHGLTPGQAKGLIKRWLDGGKVVSTAAGFVVAV